jgi:hypothetical protein
MAEVVHLAGPQIEFDGVIRQRCVRCGALIEERDRSRTAVKTDPTASEEVQREEAARTIEAMWTGWVAIDGHVKWSVDELEDGRAPERSCMRPSRDR